MPPVAKSSAATGASPRSKPVPSSAGKAAAAEEKRDSAPVEDAPAVKVVVRVRPAVSLRTDMFFVHKTSPSSVAVGDRSFAVDGFLDDRASQADAFDLVGVPMIENVLAGFNSSLVCYGQSGTGKTYTMRGALAAMVHSSSDHADRGVVPWVFQNLFAQIQGREENSPEKQTSYQCQCSFLEIRENAGNGIHVDNLTDGMQTKFKPFTRLLPEFNFWSVLSPMMDLEAVTLSPSVAFETLP
uniref:Kinesin motor domain-containing protein n=1 Tax=Leersia perrieri TaxID=77586 RepID=A0A0D9VVW5_9ORYZ